MKSSYELVSTLPPKIAGIFEGDAFVRGAYGGRGSAKTRSFAHMSAVYALRFADAGYRGIILCVRERLNSLDDSSMQEIKESIQDDPELRQRFEIGEKYIRTKCGRVSYKFAGLTENIESIKSKARLLLCWADEAEGISEKAWEKLIPTIREEVSELWVTWNPEKRTSATHNRFRENPEADYKITEINWRDNYWFPGILNKQRLADKRNRPDRYLHIWEGAFDELSDRKIFKNWRVGRVEVDDKITPRFGLDFGFSTDPMAFIKCYILEADKIIYVEYEAYAKGVATRHIHKTLDKVPEARRYPICADSSRPETIEHLKSDGFKMYGAKKGAGSVKEGINWLQGYEIVVSPDCPQFKSEIEDYVWQFDKRANEILDTPVDDNDHCVTGDTKVDLADGSSIRIENMVGAEYEVQTLFGPRIAKRVRKTRQDAELVRVSFANGVYIDCTPDHLFLSHDGSWIEAAQLANGQSIVKISEGKWRSNTRESTPYSTGKNSTLLMAGSSPQKSLGRLTSICTGLYGSITTVISRIACIYTTRTTTSLTMPFKISSLSHLKNMPGYTRRRLQKMISSRFGKEWITPEFSLLNGMARQKADCGIANTEYPHTRTDSTSSSSAFSVKQASNLRIGASQSFAATLASLNGDVMQAWTTLKKSARNVAVVLSGTSTPKQKHAQDHAQIDCAIVENVRLLPWREDVYCMNVEEAEHFSSNGIVIHNCIDGLRYAVEQDRLRGANIGKKRTQRLNLGPRRYA